MPVFNWFWKSVFANHREPIIPQIDCSALLTTYWGTFYLSISNGIIDSKIRLSTEFHRHAPFSNNELDFYTTALFCIGGDFLAL